MSRTAPKQFEQKGKVRFVKPPITQTQIRANHHRNSVNTNANINAVPTTNMQTNGQFHPQQQILPLPVQTRHPMPNTNPHPNVRPMPISNVRHGDPTPATPYKVFPKRPNQIWETTMIHEKEPNGIDALEFGVSFVWRAGCQLDEWPFDHMSVSISCSWKKDFVEIEKYMKEIRPGGKKQHLSHHWMLCEIHPYSTNDIEAYGNFCNYYKDLNKVSAAMCKSDKHQHLLFYLCPPDENVLSEQYLDDVFHCTLPKGLLWCLIFVKNLDYSNEVKSKSVMQPKNVSPNVKDPRKRKRKKERKEVEKEKSDSLGADSGQLMGMLGNLEDSLKGQAGVVLTNSQEY